MTVGVPLAVTVTLPVRVPVDVVVPLRVDEGVTDAVTDCVYVPVPVTVTESVGDTVLLRLTVEVTLMLEVTEMDKLAGVSITPAETPFPSSPYVSSPQQEMAPPNVRAHVCENPVVMALTPVMTGVDGGVTRLLVPPLPNWPFQLYPQQYTPNDMLRAHV